MEVLIRCKNIVEPTPESITVIDRQIIFRLCFLFFCSIVQSFNCSTDSIDNQFITNCNLIDEPTPKSITVIG